ncbi:MAG: hypothetical protein AAFX54_03090 [Pseudomonadota bacterium]
MTRLRNKKIPLVTSLIGAATLMAAAPAQACYTVHFDNKSTKDMHTVWAAFGCAGIEHWITSACEDKLVKAGESRSYDFNWGTTRPSVLVIQDLDMDDKPVAKVDYGLSGGKFEITNGSRKIHAESASGCGKSYTIKFTENDRIEWLD